MFELKIIFFHLITLFFIVVISHKLEFFDKPDTRKIHNVNIVHTGGLIIFISYFFILISSEINPQIEMIIATGSIIIFFGFLDDQYKLSPGIKLFFIFLPVIYLFYEGYKLENLGNYEYLGEIELNKFSIIFTFLSVGLLINSINYFDGVDGLCTVFLITCFVFFLLISNNIQTKQLLIYLLIPLFINLLFNLLKAGSYFKIFLGNAGSLFFGFLVSFLMIYFYNTENIHPSKLIWAVWFPVYDFLAVNFERMLMKKSIFYASRDHIHHVILNFFNNSHLKTTFILSVINILVIIFGYTLSKYFGNIHSLIAFILLFFPYLTIKINLKKTLTRI